MILLTKPRISNYPLGYALYEPLIPMGIGFIANALYRRGHKYKIIDNYLLSYQNSGRVWDKNTFINTLRAIDPTHVGLSVMSIEYQVALELISLVKNNSNALLIAGGPHATLYPESLSNYVDYVVAGEGEQAVVDIVEEKINNNFINGNIIRYPLIENLEDLISADYKNESIIHWNDFDIDEYNIKMPFWGLEKQPIINLNTSRGCPFNCKFCSIIDPWQKRYRYFSADTIFNEIRLLTQKHGVKGVCFREDCFTANRSRIVKLCQMIIDSGTQIEWAAESRVDLVDKELIRLMSAAGCKGLLFGVESGSNSMLRKMQKGITVQQTRNAFGLCREYGIKTYASIVVGLPGETEADRRQTMRLLEEIQPNYTETSVFLGIPGSAYYNQLKQEGNYEYFDKDTFHLYPKGYKKLFHQYIKNNEIQLPY